MVIIILGVSLVLYTILGGADFGAGIIELFIGEKANSTVSRAMAPVWEANHMWLIIAVVILFNGFPKVYTILSTHLHIPVLIFLIAIILRGTAFTFRHYDAYHDSSEQVYSYIFRYSSLFAVFFLGVTVSAFFSGTIPNDASGSFLDQYVYPWFNWFSFSVGLFLVTLSAYIAAIFLLGEVTTDQGYKLIKKFTVGLFLLSIISGLGIFAFSYSGDMIFHQTFFAEKLSMLVILLSALLIPIIFVLMNRKDIWKLRFVVGSQIVLIMLGWFFIQWPNLVVFSDGSVLTIFEASGPEITMKILFIALAVGVVFIFPGLYYLFRVFKSDNKSRIRTK